MIAAWREYLLWTLMSANLRYEFYKKVVALRWLDDLFLAWDESVSPEMAWILQVLRAPRFYGRKLLLKDTKKAEAFGFRVKADQRIRSHTRFVIPNDVTHHGESIRVGGWPTW